MISERRDKFPTRQILLVGESQLKAARAVLDNVPIDAAKPLELVVREQVKTRSLDSNAAMWRGPLFDIAEQAYVEGRTYSAQVWHEHYKLLYLPEEYDHELCLEGYVKWGYTPRGKQVLIGSTTDLTVKGFAQYLQQIEADAACMGVLLHAAPIK